MLIYIFSRMSTTPSESFFLELSIRPTQFAPASIENAVFFDENNEQVISVHNETKISIQTKRDAKGKVQCVSKIY